MTDKPFDAKRAGQDEPRAFEPRAGAGRLFGSLRDALLAAGRDTIDVAEAAPRVSRPGLMPMNPPAASHASVNERSQAMPTNDKDAPAPRPATPPASPPPASMILFISTPLAENAKRTLPVAHDAATSRAKTPHCVLRAMRNLSSAGMTARAMRDS